MNSFSTQVGEPLDRESLRKEWCEVGGTVSPFLNDLNSAADDAETPRERVVKKPFDKS